MHTKSIPDYVASFLRSKELLAKWGNILADVLPQPANMLVARVTRELETVDAVSCALVEHLARELGDHIVQYYRLLPTSDQAMWEYVNAHAEEIVRWLCVYRDVNRMFSAMQNSDTTPDQIVAMLDGNGLNMGGFRLTSLANMSIDTNIYRTGVMTGINDLDRYTRGLLPKQLGLLVGSYGVGKTTVMICFGIQALRQGCKVLHVTLELDENAVKMKYLRGMAGDDQVQMEEVKETLGDKLYIVEALAGGFTVPALRQAINKVKPSIVFLDYADEMYIGEHDGLYQPLGVLFRNLRGLAGQFDIPVWTASQTTRQGGKKKGLVDGADIANSIEKARIADIVITINQGNEEYLRHELRLFLDKNRNGEKHKTVRCRVAYDCPRLWPMQN